MRRSSSLAWPVWAFVATWLCAAHGEFDGYVLDSIVAPTVPQTGPHRSLLEVNIEASLSSTNVL